VWFLKNSSLGWLWWHRSVILALSMLKQEDHEFKDNLSYIERPCPKKPKN
jgi:hypothetical protein